MHMRKDRVRVLGIILVIAGVLTLIFTWLRVLDNPSVMDSLQRALDYKRAKDIVYIDDVGYLPRKGICTYLVIGIDESGEYVGTKSYNNSAQSDFLMLLVVETKQERCTLLQINRDTMASVTILDVLGNPNGTFKGQLALSHTYGNGLEKSCNNTVKAVSDFLYGTKIDGYVSFTMDAVKILNDAVGGVSVTVTEDMTAVDASLQKDSTVFLNGDLAMKYIRARGSLENSSNLARMERQRTYMTALMHRLSSVKKEEDQMMKLYDELMPYMVTDCGIDTFSEMFDWLQDYTFAGIRTPEGEAVRGEEFMEFYADEEKLQQLVIELFYERA